MSANDEEKQSLSRDATLPATSTSLDHEKTAEKIQKCCEILELDQEDLSVDSINKAWKKQLVDKRDTIGRSDNHDLVAEINNAKDTLLNWIN